MDVLNDQETLVEVGSINDIMNNYLMRKLEETQSENIEKGRKFLKKCQLKQMFRKQIVDFCMK